MVCPSSVPPERDEQAFRSFHYRKTFTRFIFKLPPVLTLHYYLLLFGVTPLRDGQQEKGSVAAS
jgi:hypothetical protein